MPIVEPKNISLGLGTLEFGEYIAGVFDAYEDVGSIKATVNLQISREILPFTTGRPQLTVKQEVISESVTVTATLAEANLATIKMALGQGNISSSIPTFLDGTNDAPHGTGQTGVTPVESGTLLRFGGSPEHSFIGIRFTHAKLDFKRLIFEGYKASPSGELALPFNETDWNLFEVSFMLLADSCRPAGEQLFQIHHEDSVPTPDCP